MPFVTDIYPPSKKIEALAGIGLAIAGRKGKGFTGKRDYEAVEVLGCFSVPLRTVTWDKGTDGCTGFVIDPQGLLTGVIRFDLIPGEPQAGLKENMGEDDFVRLCQQMTKDSTDFSPETLEFKGFITELEQVQSLLKADLQQNAVEAELEHSVDAPEIVERLGERLKEYDRDAAAWTELEQKIFAYRDYLTAKINESANESREASSRSLAELEQQVKSTIAAKSKETEEAREEARREQLKQKELLQSELERFREQFKEKGDNYWREKIRDEEQRMTKNEKKLAATLEKLNDADKRYAQAQKDRIKQFNAEKEKRLAAFDQRLKRLDTAVAGFAKGVEKRLESSREQHKKVAELTVVLTPEQCDAEFPVIFYAARYPDHRWQVFPPQLFGDRGIGGKLVGLIGGLNLPFRSATKVGDSLAAKIEDILPGHTLEAKLEEQNLLNDTEFIDEAKAGLAQLIDQGDLHKKHASLLESF